MKSIVLHINTNIPAELLRTVPLTMWALENGMQMTVHSTRVAAQIGNLNVLQWLRMMECAWDKTTCEGAAENGHLDVLQWARANGCPWDADTCSFAAKNGHLAVLEWARLTVVHGTKTRVRMRP